MSERALNEVLGAVTEDDDPSIFTASNGLQLKLKRVSQMILADAHRRLKPPTPPVVFIKEKERNEENPDDPEYQRAVAAFDQDRAFLAMRVYFVLGTEAHFVPPDIHLPTTHEWSDDILAADPSAEIPDSGRGRYYAWLRLYALPNEDSVRLLNAIIRNSGGTLQADVKAAQDSFRPDEAGDSTGGVPAGPTIEHGPGAPRVLGDGSGIRSEGSGGLRALSLDDVDGRRQLVPESESGSALPYSSGA